MGEATAQRAAKRSRGEAPSSGGRDADGLRVLRPHLREAARSKAILEITEGVCREPYFEPPDWHKRYQSALGPYKDFLLQEAEHFDVIDETEGVFSINIR